MFLALSGNNIPDTFPPLAHITLESMVVLPDFNARLDLSHCVDGCREKVGRELWSVWDVRRGAASVSLEGVPKRHIKSSIWKELVQIRAPQRRNQPLH